MCDDNLTTTLPKVEHKHPDSCDGAIDSLIGWLLCNSGLPRVINYDCLLSEVKKSA